MPIASLLCKQRPFDNLRRIHRPGYDSSPDREGAPVNKCGHMSDRWVVVHFFSLSWGLGPNSGGLSLWGQKMELKYRGRNRLFDDGYG